MFSGGVSTRTGSTGGRVVPVVPGVEAGDVNRGLARTTIATRTASAAMATVVARVIAGILAYPRRISATGLCSIPRVAMNAASRPATTEIASVAPSVSHGTTTTTGISIRVVACITKSSASR